MLGNPSKEMYENIERINDTLAGGTVVCNPCGVIGDEGSTVEKKNNTTQTTKKVIAVLFTNSPTVVGRALSLALKLRNR